MPGPEVAKAYVTIIPSLQGAQKTITQELTGAGDEAGVTAGKSSGEKFKGGFAKVLSTVGKVTAVAVTAAATGVAALTKSAVQGYAEYEQLVGGVETLYTTSAAKVQEYAANAYRTSGLSANQYMETATGFAAALVNSLSGDTAKAADMADMAITDMSDNANKMGTDITSLQTAYQGFAKGNFTMLDNLKLGYGGTKSEMERLIADANDLKVAQGGMADLTIDSYADIVEAIHLVQNEMGIAGTTAAEAGSTISGSLAMTRSAWDNLVVGLADGTADMDSLINNVVSSAETAFGNLMPVIERSLVGIASFVQKMAPIISEQLPIIVTQVLPPLISAATELIAGLVAALPALLQVLVDMAPTIISTIMDALIANLPMLVEAAVQLIATLANGISQSLPELIPAIVDLAVQIVTTLIENAPLLIEAGLQLIAGLIQGIVNAIPNLIQGIVQAAQALLDAILGFFGIHSPSTVMQGAGTDLIQGLINGIGNMLSSAVSAVTNIATAIFNVFSTAWDSIKTATSTAWSGIKSTLTNTWNNLKTGASNLKSNLSNTWNTVKSNATSAWSSISSSLSSKWTSIKSTASSTWSSIKSNISTTWSGIKSSISTAASGALTTVSTKFESIKSAMSSKLESARNAVSNVISGIKGLFNFSWSLPHLALPHFSFSGSFSLNPPSVPHLSVSWYKRAAEEGALFSTPQIIGVGDAAQPELLIGEKKLKELVGGGQNIVINVYGAPGQDINALAEIIERKLAANINRRRAVFA